jgi:formylmethanofuran dehydrogenase subunit E
MMLHKNDVFLRSKIRCADCGKKISIVESRVLDGKQLCLQDFMLRNYSTSETNKKSD